MLLWQLDHLTCGNFSMDSMKSFSRCCCKSLSFLYLLQLLTVFHFPVLSTSPIDKIGVDHQTNDLLCWTNFSVNYRGRSILNLERAGTVYSGRILAVLGPSGSGKTTFLNALSGSANRNLDVAGFIDAVNGPPLKKENIAFIYQDDSFFSQLSVRETLQLAASLKLYKDASQETIEELMRFLGLDKVADSYVGDILTRGISGGERKRLAVACEMLGTAPALLIADEPSSGLDSFQAAQVIMLLKRIAIEKNIAVVCSIHQPRSSIWNIFDDILLLGPGGVVIYHGPRTEILAYFAGIGYPCPADTNPAEFLIDLVSSDESKKLRSEDSPSESEQRARSLAITFTNSPIKLNKSAIRSDVQEAPSAPAIITERKMSVLSGPRDSFYRFGLLLNRALRQTLRDNATNTVRIGVSALLAGIIGSIFGKSGGPGPLTSQAISDKVTLIAHSSINVGMLSMIKALQLFKKERAIINRERSQGRYTAFEYLVAKLTAELPLDAFIGAVFGYIVHNRGRLQSNNHMFAGLLALVGCVTSSLGLGIGALFPNGDVALSVGPALMVVYVILGAVGPAGAGKDLPRLLRPLQWASPIRWACEALCAAELRGRTLTYRKTNPSSSLTVTRGTGFRLLSLGSVGHLLRGTVRFIGSQLLSLGDNLTKITTKEPEVSLPKSGDRTLAILNIPDADVRKSSSVLAKMLVVHVLVAWAGLLLNGSKK